MNEHAKGSTMYERFSAVAELNKAPGFDPLRFARRVVQNGGEKLMLDLKYKKLWFRLRYPQGRIKVTPLKITEQLAIIEAKVFFDRGDTIAAASFIAQRYAKETPGGLYIESAQHMAVDTALNDAGFGVQLMSAKEEQSIPVATTKDTAPVEEPIAAAMPPIVAEPVAPSVAETPMSAPAESVAEPDHVEEPSIAKMMDIPPVVEEQPAVVEQPPVASPTVGDVPQTPPALEIVPPATQASEEDVPVEEDTAAGDVRYTAAMSVDEICALMTLDEARNIIVDVGTCKGNTLAWVSERRAASLKWYLNGYQGDNNMLRAGAKLLLESLAMEKAS